jgi:hypothetical protein
MRPKARTAASTSPRASLTRPRSAACQEAFPPSAPISATTPRPAAASRPLTTTAAPSRAHARAIARPMPRVAPVTTATRP